MDQAQEVSHKPRKLPVLDTVVDSCWLLISKQFVLTVFFVKVFLVFVVVNESIGFILGFIFAGPWWLQPSGLITHLILRHVWLLLLAPFAIAIHRHIILKEEFPSKPFRGFLSSNNLSFAAVWFIFVLPILFLGILNLNYALQYQNILLFSFIGQIVYFVLVVRVLIYLPFIAIGKRQSLGGCWSVTRRNHWRLLAIFAVAGVFNIGLSKLFIAPMTVYFTEHYNESFSNLGNTVSTIGLDVLANAVFILTVALSVAMASHVLNFFIHQQALDAPTDGPV